MYKVIAFTGKSGAGKDLITSEINETPGVVRIVATTTRPPRDGEINGIAYWFASEKEFINKLNNNEFFTNTSFRGWYYGTEYANLNKTDINIGIFTPKDIENLRQNKEIDLFVVEVVASDKTRLLRSLNRESDPDVKEIIRRFGADEEDFKNFKPDFTIMNETWYDFHNLDSTVRKLFDAWNNRGKTVQSPISGIDI